MLKNASDHFERFPILSNFGILSSLNFFTGAFLKFLSHMNPLRLSKVCIYSEGLCIFQVFFSTVHLTVLSQISTLGTDFATLITLVGFLFSMSSLMVCTSVARRGIFCICMDTVSFQDEFAGTGICVVFHHKAFPHWLHSAV